MAKPVLANVAGDGLVNARTVVLRGVEIATETLHVYTDQRSSKVSELVDTPEVPAESARQFALPSAHVREMDWLELGSGGHRRARVLADSWQWLNP